MSFDWSDLELCTTGIPSTAPNPPFLLQDVPRGTTFNNYAWQAFAPEDENGMEPGRASARTDYT